MTPKRKNRAKRRTIYVLPNLITALSLFAGFYGLISAVNGRFLAAATAILVAAILDTVDGTVARVTKTTSFFGREYDSLCDLVAFGVAPALLMYQWALKPGKLQALSSLSGETKTLSLGLVICFIYVACGSLRLARFNVNSDQRDPGFFQGIPITGGAVILCSAVFWHYRSPNPLQPSTLFILVLTLVTSFLMVSAMDYISLKHKAIAKNPHPFETLVLAVLVLGILVVKVKTLLLPVCILYMATGPFVTFFRRKAGLPAPGPEPPLPGEGGPEGDRESGQPQGGPP
ncbi:MAG: phosphatidylcholine/phosphatidylserine synthase [Deltaproteobacteria bacterium]|jgi:CDP-diacylglycerol--serine O-phosphatidyltransferase|nr:phosphatidylcholine/phosphatidylserine synthase [Deltaproteobacteria bacterium]